MAKVICIGLGPGDPELMSVKARRLLAGARLVACFRKAGHPGQARRIVEGLIPAGAVEWPMEYPVTTEIPFDDPAYNAALAPFYDGWAARLAEAGRLGDAWLVEHGTMPGQRVRRLAGVDGKAPYFSIVPVHGRERRP